MQVLRDPGPGWLSPTSCSEELIRGDRPRAGPCPSPPPRPPPGALEMVLGSSSQEERLTDLFTNRAT